ncbi:hypothetical protein SAMN05216223_105276 [Actinacidiphila yanglinensis]|uniref:Uncharacterized protein n=1 Tax=Actinacidiphila yanglinensis TaxID=310779 RepID=A0A1H6AB45_9ACTN|nr:hypothetical protein SAMN05216223_105276 [Actinacidiphila yanglinensis]
MVVDVGTSCATIDDTPETSLFTPRHRVDAPWGLSGNRPSPILYGTLTAEMGHAVARGTIRRDA